MMGKSWENDEKNDDEILINLSESRKTVRVGGKITLLTAFDANVKGLTCQRHRRGWEEEDTPAKVYSILAVANWTHEWLMNESFDTE